MKRIKEIIVVEGKTDTALLKELFEVETIETHGLALDCLLYTSHNRYDNL